MSENRTAKTPMDGGAAFPVAHSYLIQSGMSLRDYLAAKAMQIQMANKKEMNYWAEEYSVDEMWGFCARNAYEMADAMLKARER
jgi:hypothetical protein